MSIMDTLENAEVPVNFHSIIHDYFQDWVVIVQMASGMIRKEKTCGVLQGSVLGPLLWNIAFDDSLKEDIPLVVNIIWYINDTLVVTAEDNISMLKQRVNTALEAMTCWIESARLSLATTRMEVVLFTHHRPYFVKGGRK